MRRFSGALGKSCVNRNSCLIVDAVGDSVIVVAGDELEACPNPTTGERYVRDGVNGEKGATRGEDIERLRRGRGSLLPA